MDYVPFEEMLANAIKKDNKLYQVQGVEKTNKAIIRHIGNGNGEKELAIELYSFERNNYKYTFLSHVLQNLNVLDIMSLNITNTNKECFMVLSYEFETKKRDIGKELDGLFRVYVNVKSGKKILLNTNKEYIGNNEIMHYLMEFLEDLRVVKYFIY